MNINTVRIGDKEVLVVWYVHFGTPLLYEIIHQEESVLSYFTAAQLERIFNSVLLRASYV